MPGRYRRVLSAGRDLGLRPARCHPQGLTARGRPREIADACLSLQRVHQVVRPRQGLLLAGSRSNACRTTPRPARWRGMTGSAPLRPRR